MLNLLAQTSAATVANDALLPLLLVVPVIGAIVVSFFRKQEELARVIALGVAVAMLPLAFLLLYRVLGVEAGTTYASTFVSQFRIEQLGADQPVRFVPTLAADAMGAWMVLLTSLLMPLAIWASFGLIKERQASYHAWMLLLAAALVGAFLSRDALQFYVFFEVSLVPCFFIITGWGGPDRVKAAIKFFVYTFLGSLFMLTSILYMGSKFQTFDVVQLATFAQHNLSGREQFWVLVGLLAGLAVKVPIIPLHTWLPKAYTQAPRR
ncbi:MAG: proton-conducting transporter membrane subunit [Tepidisphaeraceae bacterium]